MTFLAQTEGMGWFGWFWMLLLLGLGFFMILLVLLQRGRGGGLVGALGGAGGQSAFGTRAGDVFTKITVVVATLWVATAGVGGIVLRNAATSASSGIAEEVQLDAPGAPDDLGTVGEPIDGGFELETDDSVLPDTGDETMTDPEAEAAPAGDGEETLTAPELKDPNAEPDTAESDTADPAAEPGASDKSE